MKIEAFTRTKEIRLKMYDGTLNWGKIDSAIADAYRLGFLDGVRGCIPRSARK